MRPAVLAWIVAAAVVAGCSRPAPAPIPEPDLTGAGPDVLQAVRAAQEEVRRNPRSAEAWGRLGDRYWSYRWLPESAACYGRAAEIDPHDFRWPYLMGHSERLDDPEKAAAAFARALALDDSDVSAHESYARVLARLGRTDEAREHFERALQLDPESPHALLGLGQLALSKEDFEGARGFLERAAEMAPDYGQVHLALAQVYLALGDRERARQHSETARRLPTSMPDLRHGDGEVEPVGAFALAKRGKELADAGQLAEATDLFRRALEGNPDYAVAHFNLGVVLSQQRELAEAETHLREALRLKPAYLEAHALLGEVLFRTGRPAEAETHLGQALQMNPDDLSLRLLMGRTLAAQGRHVEAERQFREGLRTSPDDARLHYYLALSLWERNETGAALAELRETLRISLAALDAARDEAEIRRLRVEAAEARRQLGAWLLEQGNREEAASQLEEAARLRPDHDETLRLLEKARRAP